LPSLRSLWFLLPSLRLCVSAVKTLLTSPRSIPEAGWYSCPPSATAGSVIAPPRQSRLGGEPRRALQPHANPRKHRPGRSELRDRPDATRHVQYARGGLAPIGFEMDRQRVERKREDQGQKAPQCARAGHAACVPHPRPLLLFFFCRLAAFLPGLQPLLAALGAVGGALDQLGTHQFDHGLLRAIALARAQTRDARVAP